MSDSKPPLALAREARELAEAATPGPWRYDERSNFGESSTPHGVWTDGECERCGWPEDAPVAAMTSTCSHATHEADARFIARALWCRAWSASKDECVTHKPSCTTLAARAALEEVERE